MNCIKHLINTITCGKQIIKAITSIYLLGMAVHADAQLPFGTVLTIEQGSYFTMGGGGTPTPLIGEDNIVIGTAPGNTGTGSHGGSPVAGDVGAVTKPWAFFTATGYDYILTTPVTEIAPGELDYRGWTVTWNGVDPIPMGGCSSVPGGCDQSSDGTIDFNDTGIATFVWSGISGDPYTLDYTSHVPVGDASGFGGVQYDQHLEGVIIIPGNSPTTQPDNAKTIVGNPISIDVLANDSSADGLDCTSVAISTSPNDGQATPDTDSQSASCGNITYLPNTAPDFMGADTFMYTVDSGLGISSAPTAVNMDVEANVAPVANDDAASTNPQALDNAGGDLVIDVLANDTDANNNPGLPGGIDTTKVSVLSQPVIGVCTANGDGTITYSQTPPSTAGQFSCTYQVSDIDTFNTPLVSNTVTVDINIASLASDWPSVLDPDIIPVLLFEAGVPGSSTDTSVPPLSGSYFTMQVTPSTLIYTVMIPGPSAGVVVGHDQPGSGSHTGAPTGNEETGIDQGWNFFANTGLHYTQDNGVSGNTDGTLEFFSKWFVTWNGIPAINLGGSPTQFPEDLGFATILCTPAPCGDQSAFTLNYAAHVPKGDPSGFGGVPYTLFLKGTVGFLDGSLETSSGNFTSENRLASTDVPVDSEVDLQCVGDCFDFTVGNITTAKISVVIPLAGGVPLNPVWRYLDNGEWASFDTTQGDTIESAPFAPGTMQCPAPSDSAYGPLTTGHYCLQLTITDNGPNDKDPAVGTITDPSGMGSGGSAGGGVVFADNRTTNSSGCTIAANNIYPLQHLEWWLLTGLTVWLGRNRRHRARRLPL